MGVSWIDHRGKQILYVDYRGLTDPGEQVDVLGQESAILEQAPNKVLVLADFEGASATSEYMGRLHEAGKTIRREKVAKTAVLGITGLKGILFDSYVKITGDTNVRTFDTRFDALDWLAE